jgi:hypothetical protein
MSEHPKPLLEQKQLDFLVGIWRTEGELLNGVFNPPIKINGTDTYEWVLEGRFLLHRANVRIGKDKIEFLELIGNYDHTNKTFLMRAFDSNGEFTTMLASVESDGILKISGKGMRSTLSLGENGKVMTAFWERSDDGSNWVEWMEMTFSR